MKVQPRNEHLVRMDFPPEVPNGLLVFPSVWRLKKNRAKFFSQCFATSASGLSSQNAETARELKMKTLFILF